jgi:hypothetical protein
MTEDAVETHNLFGFQEIQIEAFSLKAYNVGALGFPIPYL